MKFRFVVILFMAPLLLSGCGETLVDDPVIEKAVRETLGKPNGSLTKEDLEEITALDVSGSSGKYRFQQISKHFKNLTHLDVSYTNASLYDLSPLPSLVSLNVSGNNLYTTDLVEIERFQNLKELDLSFNRIEEWYNINRIKTLKRLSISGYDMVVNLDELNSLVNLEFLKLVNHHEPDSPDENRMPWSWEYSLQGLERFRQLKSLEIGGFPAKKFELLEGLPNLEKLTIHWNYNINPSMFGELDGLRNLKLCNCNLRELDGFQSIAGLEELDLRHNPFDSLEALVSLTNLKKLYLGNNEISKADVQVLKERLPNCQITYIEYPSITTEVLKRAIKQKGRKTRTLDELTHLSIGGVKLIPWELSRLRSLTGLLLTDGELQNVVGLGTLPSLEVLSLTRNKISDLTGLENCEELKHLMLVENGLTTLPQGIEKLVQIEDLNLTSNELKNIAPLSKLVNLKTLHLGGNPIDDFTGLSPLSEIQVLNLANTGLIELPSSISSLVKLENLMISDNRIKQLDQLSGLKNLKRLSIQNNDLSTIPLGLRELTSLEILDLRKNKLNKRQINELQKHLPTCRIKHDLE